MLFIGVIGTPILVRIRDLQHVFIKQFVLYGGMHASLRVCFTSMYFSKYARVYGTSHSKISVKRLYERTPVSVPMVHVPVKCPYACVPVGHP